MALRIGERGPKIRNVPVRVSVPRRFFSKVVDYSKEYEPHRQSKTYSEALDEKDVASPSSDEKADVIAESTGLRDQASYSPQDVRSSLPRERARSSSDVDPAHAGSPEGRKPMVRANITTQKPTPKREDSIIEEVSEHESAALAKVSEPEPTVTATDLEDNSPALKVSADKAVKATTLDELKKLEGQSSADIVPNIEDRLATPQPTGIVTDSKMDTTQTQEAAKFQNKTPNKLDKAAIPIVKLPKMSDAALIPDKSTTAGEARATSEATKVDTKSSEREIVDSEEEAGQESSFLSAQEDITATGSAPEFNEKPSTKHGTDASVIQDIDKPLLEEPASPPPPKVLETSLPTKSTSTRTQDKVVGSTEPTDTGNKDTSDVTATADDVPKMDTATVKSLADATKKNGPQQTPSLNPFAKKPKAQRLKEKELTKKEKKKREQEEKAAKAKASKGTSPTSPISPISPTSPTAAGGASTLKPPMETTDAAERVARMTTECADESKNKAKAPTPMVSSPPSVIEVKKESSGKQIRFTTIQAPDVNGSVTLKAQVAQKAIKTPAVDDHQAASALLSIAQSRDGAGVHGPDASTVPKSLGTKVAVNESDAQTPSTLEVSPAGRKLTLNLENPPTTNDSPLSSTSNSTPLANPIATPAISRSKSQQLTLMSSHLHCHVDMADFQRKSSAASIASSTTLNGGENGQPSPSPATENFVTPLQTPGLPQEQSPKPKKKRKPKKKKKSAATAEVSVAGAAGGSSGNGANQPNGGPSSSESESDEKIDTDPFGEQMSHIDAIRKEVKNPNSYFAKANRELEEAERRERESGEQRKVRDDSDQ